MNNSKTLPLTAIFLDLDETLIHSRCTEEGPPSALQMGNFRVWLRPCAMAIIEAAKAKGVPVMICTSALREYATDASALYGLGFSEDMIMGREHLFSGKSNVCPQAVLIDDFNQQNKIALHKCATLGIDSNRYLQVPTFKGEDEDSDAVVAMVAEFLSRFEDRVPPVPQSRNMVIVSGGQTGADRAGLDFAIESGIPHSGWCPKGRIALDGPLDNRYNLRETPSASYPQRTEWNARDSDGTVVFTLSPTISGGSKKTLDFARKHGRPAIHLHSGTPMPANTLAEFVRSHSIKRLNVAGSRESKEPGLYAWVRTVLEEANSLW